MPSLALAGWEDVCPPLVACGETTRKNDLAANAFVDGTQRKIDAGLCLFIAIQWFLMGGFPLVRTQKWWADPGAFITACAVLAGAIALIPVVDGFAKLPALIAMLAWLWWFGLLIWRTLQFGWRMTTAWRVPRSS